MAIIDDHGIGIILILSSIAIALTIYLATQRRGVFKKSDITVEEKMIEKERPTAPLPVDVERTVDPEEAGRASEDLKVLDIEKEIVSYALTRLYEAEAEGKITQDDRTRLVNKYKAEMRRLDEQIGERQMIVKLHELESAQEDLAKMFHGKFDEIGKTVDNIRSNLEALPKEEAEVQAKPPVEALPARPEGRKVEREPPTGVRDPHKTKAEEKIEAIQDEVLKILARIEQMEIEE